MREKGEQYLAESSAKCLEVEMAGPVPRFSCAGAPLFSIQEHRGHEDQEMADRQRPISCAGALSTHQHPQGYGLKSAGRSVQTARGADRKCAWSAAETKGEAARGERHRLKGAD